MQALSNREVLAILIRTGSKECSSLQIADQILHQAQGIGNLATMQIDDLKKIKGLKEAKSLELLACFEVAKRMSYEECLRQDVIQAPDSMVQWLNQEIGFSEQELFLVVLLNVRNQILHHEVLFKGTLDRSLVHPREIFKKALLYSSARIILVHNHPSGNIEPSCEDLLITEQIVEIGKLMHIDVLDHLIVSKNHCFSFKQEGLLD